MPLRGLRFSGSSDRAPVESGPVNWLWLHFRLSLRLGGTDMWKFRDHLMIGIGVAVVSVVLSYVATGSAGALYVLLAWPAALMVFFLFFVARRLTGWDGLWEHGWQVTTLHGGRHQLTSSLTPKQGPLLALVPPERSCVLRLLAGQEIGPVVTQYPGGPSASFKDGPGFAPGAYAVIWRERNPPQTGRLRVIAYYRRTVLPATPEQASAVQPPEASNADPDPGPAI